MNSNNKMKRVGIIGAGAAGLCALRRVLALEEFTPIAWEHSSKVGGTWSFNPKVGTDEKGYPIHSSMYSSLRTNIPKEVMGFPDFPFKRGGKSFVHHTEVLQYLNSYADNYNLMPWIKFEQHVDNVEWVEDHEDDKGSWDVTVRDLNSGKSETTNCHAILVCNGHYSVPNFPKITGLKTFSGGVSHSHDYRNPENFKNKNVIVLGAAASGMDIALEVAKVAKQVYLSHNMPVPIPSVLPRNLKQVKGIDDAFSNGFVLKDKTEVEVDYLICCTGYEFSFPFLNPSCDIKVEDNQVKTLYKHIVNTSHPTMAFVGVAFQIVPFPVFDMQILYFLNYLQNKIKLPTKIEMVEKTYLENEKKIYLGSKKTHMHKFGNYQWPYMSQLGQEIGISTDSLEALENLYNIVWERRKFSLSSYKELEYIIEYKKENEYEIKEFRNGVQVSSRMELTFLTFVQVSKLLLFNFRDTVNFAIKLMKNRWKALFSSPPD